MCGITGALWWHPERAIDAAALERMTEVLRHRGPNDAGSYQSSFEVRPGYGARPGVALGFRRLSIVDVAGGHQPLANEDESIWVVANGEIYNHVELRRRLEGAGHRFRTQSDCEVLVHLYEDLGPGLLEHVNGMFAFALWDAPRGRLLLARDRLGKKPLVYRLEPDRLLFASELKSLLAAPDVPRSVDPQALDEYLTYQYVPHPRTIFRGIAKLPPAHYALWSEGRLTVARYWNPDFQRQFDRPLADWADELRALLSDSVRLRMASDVPLGAFLSGGVDSSLIVGLMQRLAREPVKTFSIGFAAPQYDETRFARQIAQRLGTDHREFRVEADAVKILPKLAWFYDEPFGDSSAVPTYYVSQLAREHVTVALTGDGGDELFAGYPRYRATQWAGHVDRLPARMRRLLAARIWQRLAGGGRQRSPLRRLGRFCSALAESPARRHVEWIAIFNEARRAALYDDDWLSQLPNADPIEFVAAAIRQASRRDAVTAATLADLVTYLPCDLLTKVDIASMAHGLECRQPFLDYRVVELAMAMPVGLKLGWGGSKQILRQTFADLMPQKRPKMGFGVPLAEWFRGPLGVLAREVLLDRQAMARGYFRRAAVEQLLNEHGSGRFDHGYRLWSLLLLELWHHQWVDGNELATTASLQPIVV